MSETPLTDMASESFATVPEHVVLAELPEGLVALSLKHGQYYALNEVGSRMYSLFKENGDLDAVVGALLQEYEVKEEELRRDLQTLIEDLVSADLLQLHDDQRS